MPADIAAAALWLLVNSCTSVSHMLVPAWRHASILLRHPDLPPTCSKDSVSIGCSAYCRSRQHHTKSSNRSKAKHTLTWSSGCCMHMGLPLGGVLHCMAGQQLVTFKLAVAGPPKPLSSPAQWCCHRSCLPSGPPACLCCHCTPIDRAAANVVAAAAAAGRKRVTWRHQPTRLATAVLVAGPGADTPACGLLDTLPACCNWPGWPGTKRERSSSDECPAPSYCNCCFLQCVLVGLL